MRRLAGPVMAAMLTCLPAAASEVQDLTTFSAGTPARASEVNANFSAVKAAVDDNHGRLQQVESGKQNRISGVCEVGSAITAVAEDGSVSCASFRDDAGALRVWHDAFRAEWCEYVSSAQTSGASGERAYFRGSEDYECQARAQIFLPDGVSITGMSCRVHDTMSGDRWLDARLTRMPVDLAHVAGTAPDPIVETSRSTGTSSAAAMEEVSGTAYTYFPDWPVVDNEEYIYRVWVRARGSVDGTLYDGFNWIGDRLRFYGCTVTYTR